MTPRSGVPLWAAVGGQLRERHPEGRAPAKLALDRDPPAMAGDDVLHDGEPEPGAALLAALDNVGAVEAFGQARQVLGRDAGAMIAHGKLDLGRATPGGTVAGEPDLDALARAAVFHRVLDEVLDDPQQLVAVALDHERTFRCRK